jgi:hypothetical protein
MHDYHAKPKRQGWLSWLLCRAGCHDWRDMDGVCCECGYVDPLWRVFRP